MSIVIEKGIPLPEPRNRASEIGDAVRSAEVGDSFLIDRKAARNLGNYAKGSGRKFVQRKVDDRLARVWRVA